MRLAHAEVLRRGMTVEQCGEILGRDDAATSAGIALVGIAAAARYGGTAGSPRTSSVTMDYAWDWDEYQMAFGGLTWGCRGIQTGQYAELEKCRLLPKTDLRWPSKVMGGQ